ERPLEPAHDRVHRSLPLEAAYTVLGHQLDRVFDSGRRARPRPRLVVGHRAASMKLEGAERGSGVPDRRVGQHPALHGGHGERRLRIDAVLRAELANQLLHPGVGSDRHDYWLPERSEAWRRATSISLAAVSAAPTRRLTRSWSSVTTANDC